ncbi:hypothetical protein BU14_0075s0038 [Porphyra umbilicalis]|uniref:Uncharacterized protein n=1 Tax=Porphyra umbilicalis TaxID=2786 RepID=A0A1X6PFC8_PORUM|nr:hypothetical protein BU14_0075s0038 [Porphyra umbilicalis]|eukprot:OSX79548.1 hypothetical protein BU14_0075s0038 [Porphyra umbilicalis]
MYGLSERLNHDVKEALVKLLVKPAALEGLLGHLTLLAPPRAEDADAAASARRYPYVISMLLSSGPIQLRRALYLSPRHLDQLFGCLAPSANPAKAVGGGAFAMSGGGAAAGHSPPPPPGGCGKRRRSAASRPTRLSCAR